jgi:hypothetical protein
VLCRAVLCCAGAPGKQGKPGKDGDDGLNGRVSDRARIQGFGVRQENLMFDGGGGRQLA